MQITQEQLIQLNRLYNTLGLIFTRGEDTMMMSTCLQALKNLIQDISTSQPEEKTFTVNIPINKIPKDNNYMEDSPLDSNLI